MRYAIVGLPAYIDNSNCHEYGLNPNRYGWDGNEKPTKKQAIAALKSRMDQIGVTVGALDWAYDGTGWWCLGFKEYVSYDISDCPKSIPAYKIMQKQDYWKDYLFGGDGEAHITSAENPQGPVKGRIAFVIEEDRQGEQYSFFELRR